MRKTFIFTAAMTAIALASPVSATDVVVMKFVADDCQNCSTMENLVDTAIARVGTANVTSVTIDTSNAAKWEGSAYGAFDADVVPTFNQYAGLTGFTAVVDPKTDSLIGCVDDDDNSSKITDLIQTAAASRQGSSPVLSGNYQCPPVKNKLPH
ncbi:hypothetical protein [Robiginitomaculum antarcticum]|uniref:hypothetical protein n=1 Tax=Robiginitomaculum antarcticum TaxID=437507 RepID=UPI00037FCDDF|nr:hypothetical protein [Robiginitomaculum antarcticum]